MAKKRKNIFTTKDKRAKKDKKANITGKATYYLAYGSNTNQEQMKERCPDAVLVGKTKLQDYRLRFRGGNHCAVATIEKAKGYFVPALIWRISQQDEESLDSYEGFPFLYRKEYLDEIHINDHTYQMMAYVMNKRPGMTSRYGTPSKVYYETIADGYLQAGFDLWILEEAIKASKVSS